MRVSTDRFAQGVRIEVPGWVAEDGWFPLLPGTSRDVALRPVVGRTPPAAPRGRVVALNLGSASLVAPRD